MASSRGKILGRLLKVPRRPQYCAKYRSVDFLQSEEDRGLAVKAGAQKVGMLLVNHQ